MKKILAVFALASLVLSSNGDNQFLKMEKAADFKEKSAVLNKSLGSVSLTSFVSAKYNVDFTCPTGWTITELDTGLDYYSMTVSRPLYYDIGIFGSKKDSKLSAKYYNFACTHSNVNICYNASLLMPSIYYIHDTTYSSTQTSSATSTVKYYRSSTTSYDAVGVVFAESFDVFEHNVFYYVTASEYSSYNSEYVKTWFNLSFYSYSTPAIKTTVSALPKQMTVNNGLVTINTQEQQKVKLDLYNLLGQRVAKVFDGEVVGQRQFDVNGSMQSNQMYLIKMESDKKIEAQKMNSVK